MFLTLQKRDETQREISNTILYAQSGKERRIEGCQKALLSKKAANKVQ